MTGKIELICGSMFSGKTEELLRRVRRAIIAGEKVSLYKPSIDIRYDNNCVSTHNLDKEKAIVISSIEEINEDDSDVIAIDEGQFFPNLYTKIKKLVQKGYRIIIASLDMNYLGQPYEEIGKIAMIADTIQKLHAICKNCKKDAVFSNYIGKNTPGVGGIQEYEALCRKCFEEKNTNKTLNIEQRS